MITSLLSKITKITQAVKHKDRVHLELDNKYWVTITKDQLVGLGLYKGQSVDAEEKKKIEEQANLQKVTNKVLDYIAIRPRSTKEVERYMEKKGLEDLKEEVLLYLNERKYLDDDEFTKWYVENRVSFGVHGPNKIKAELTKLGVSSSTIGKVIKEALEDKESQEEQMDTIVAYITKIAPRIKAKDKYELQNKIFSRLAGRGFQYEDIKRGYRMYLEDSTKSTLDE